MLAIALATTVGLGVLVGLAVGLAQTRGPLVSLARESLRSHSRDRRRSRLHGATVAIQFALTLLLANGTALMLRSYLNAVQIPRMLTFAMLLFASVGLVLGGAGLYGVVAYHVARRRHEIGIRMAIGAERGQVVRMVLRQGLVLAGIGTFVGLLAALVSSKAIAGLLFGVAAVDLLSIAVVVSLLALVAVLGTAVPALRAAAVNPVDTLRSE